MEKARTIFRTVRVKATEKGSALLVSLMVLVGLSLLGLGFVALSETESSIAVNQKNHAQTVAFAEAGARVVVQWFQDPETARARGIMPVNSNAIKTERTVDGNGWYKPDTGTPELLCDKPFKPVPRNRFYGTVDSADIMITEANAEAFLNTFNEKVFPPTALFGSDTRRRTQDSNLRITDIRIYAPPIIGGALVGDGGTPELFFWRGGTRYGVATIRVVAEQFHPSTHNITARGIATIVVAEFPVPHPLGPLQSASTLSTNGSFEVGWGMITADDELVLKRNSASLPWFDAYDMAHFEHGYDSSTEWKKGTFYSPYSVVRPSAASISAKPALATVEFVTTAGGTSDATNEPPTVGPNSWTATVGGTLVDNTVTWTARRPTVWPNDSSIYNGHNWLYELVGRTVEDPWFEVRSRKAITQVSPASTVPQPYKYDQVTDVFWGKGALNSHWFQHQAYNLRPEYKEVKFPAMDYDFWKAVAISANGQGNVHYLQYVGGNYTDGANTRTPEQWMTNGPGYYFFDTTNGLNPQKGGPGILGPEVKVNGNIGVPMQGLFYLNNDFKTTGINSAAYLYNQPGEPYRDIGYRKVATSTGGGQTLGEWYVDPSGNYTLEGAFNNTFSYQELPWANGGDVPSQSTFQVYMRQKTFRRESAPGTDVTEWVPVPYYPGCTPGDNATLGVTPTGCSEPHEPYLNLRYSGSALNVVTGWNDPATLGYPKKNTRTATAITCNATSPVADCTSNAWDETGGVASLDVGLDGVMYIEGGFYSTGNTHYYGSVMANIVDNKGNPTIWFDQELLRNWPPKGFKLPRVMVTTVQTDQ